MRKMFCLFIIIGFCDFAKAQNLTLNDSEVRPIIEKALRFIELEQRQETLGTDYFKGEWPSTINNEARILFLGARGKKAYDSNCFTTALVHNILAEVYLSNNKFNTIPPMLDDALENIELFRHGDTFKFWHILNRPEQISRKKHYRNPEKYLQSGPTHFFYRSRFINAHANIFDDADDTALAYAAIILNRKVHLSLGDTLPKQKNIGPIFENNRDINRRNINWYNLLFGVASRTHAYMTWFGEEKYAAPWRWFTPRGNQPNMPYGANDVCPLVNADILTTLALNNELETGGVEDACNLIEKIINREDPSKYTVYYPTEFNLDYVVAKSIVAGVKCLEVNKTQIISRILGKQNDDGSWKSDINKNDVQASLYAINALIKIADFNNSQIKESIEQGLRYIISSGHEDDDLIYWTGGVFFSGGTIVKKTHVWRSDVYTTALALEAFNSYVNSKNTHY